MKLACSTAPFGADRLDMAIVKVAWAGYEAVELVLETGALPEADLLRRRLRVEEVEVAAVHAGPLPAGPAATAVEGAAGIGRAVTLARALDCGLVVVTAPHAGSLEDLAGVLRLLDRALGDVAVRLCLANAPGTLLARPEDFQNLWGLGLPERVGIALDPGRALLAGWDPLNWEALPELPRHVYFNSAGQDRIQAPGEGRPDPKDLVAVLRREGYGSTLTVTLENADPISIEPLAKELREEAQGWLAQN